MVYIDRPNSTPLMGKSEKIAPLFTLATKLKILDWPKWNEIHQLLANEHFSFSNASYLLHHIHVQINQFDELGMYILPRFAIRLVFCIVANVLHTGSNGID